MTTQSGANLLTKRQKVRGQGQVCMTNPPGADLHAKRPKVRRQDKLA